CLLTSALCPPEAAGAPAGRGGGQRRLDRPGRRAAGGVVAGSGSGGRFLDEGRPTGRGRRSDGTGRLRDPSPLRVVRQEHRSQGRPVPPGGGARSSTGRASSLRFPSFGFGPRKR